jgi:3-deoxy-7-phosphoheptulonate synthase
MNRSDIKVGFVSLGCSKNLVDTEVMLAKLVEAGYEITPEDVDADIIIVNTCAFIESAKKEAIDSILDVAWLKEHCNLPIILDPSHAMGYTYGVPDLARACTAMGIDGLLIETHPTPCQAQSDAPQQLDHPQFVAMYESLKPIAQAVGKTLV